MVMLLGILWMLWGVPPAISRPEVGLLHGRMRSGNQTWLQHDQPPHISCWGCFCCWGFTGIGL